jgi:hypothetical protein
VEKYGTAIPATDDSIIRLMRFVCWITKATGTHSEYVILIAFPQQQRLFECTLILRLYVHCLSSLMLLSNMSATKLSVSIKSKSYTL